MLGSRDTATCQKLLDKIGIEGRTFLTDDWKVFHKLIPEDQLLTGKDLTFPIKQDNSHIRHYLARFRHRAKAVSKTAEMVEASLRLHHYLDKPENYAALSDSLLSIILIISVLLNFGIWEAK